MSRLERVLQRSIKGDGRVNEDRAGGSEDVLWVLDGATGLGPSRIPTTTDAAWFVEAIDAALSETTEETASLADMLATAVAAVARRWEVEAGPATDEWHAPSAAIAMIRVLPGEVDMLALGDCRIVYRHNGAIEAFGANDIAPLETRGHAALAALFDADPALSLADARRRVDPILRENRVKMNSLDGYWVLGLDPRPVAKALTAAIPLAAGESKPFMIASDGYLRLAEVYGAATLEDLLDDIAGVGQRLGQLRAIEAEDEACRRYVRFKCRDDATVLHGVAHG